MNNFAIVCSVQILLLWPLLRSHFSSCYHSNHTYSNNRMKYWEIICKIFLKLNNSYMRYAFLQFRRFCMKRTVERHLFQRAHSAIFFQHWFGDFLKFICSFSEMTFFLFVNLIVELWMHVISKRIDLQNWGWSWIEDKLIKFWNHIVFLFPLSVGRRILKIEVVIFRVLKQV